MTSTDVLASGATGAVTIGLTAAAALCTGLAGGVYFAFSALVMPALRTLPQGDAVTTMQRINVSAVRAPFMAVFLGGAVLAVGVIVAELVSGAPTSTEGLARIAGAILSFAAFGITVVRNVPLNNSLMALSPESDGIASAWAAFDRGWTRANHARGVVATVGAATLVASLVRATG